MVFVALIPASSWSGWWRFAILWTPPPVGKWVEQLSLSDLNYIFFFILHFS